MHLQAMATDSTASFPSPCTTFFLLLFVTNMIPASFSQTNDTNTPVPPANACGLTTNPTFCKTVLPPRTTSNLYGYGRYLVKKSIEQSTRLSSLLDRTINDRAALTAPALGALKDCLYLSQLTTDLLVASFTTLNSTNNLADAQGDNVQTLLSAIVTNQQTCYDGLTQANFLRTRNSLTAPLVNGSQLYSVSLAMFTHSWARKTRRAVRNSGKHGRTLMDDLTVGRDGVPKWVNPDILQRSRRVLVADTGSVRVKTMVTVAQDGTGNYDTIQAAVSSAPNNTDPSNGYYVIYVKAGTYQEYVSVDKKKKNLMLVGDGINQTIITGSRSVGDGFTTFNSATLAIAGQNFIGRDFTVQNTAGPVKHQAVAVRNGADLSTFYRCSFEGYQDTLYTHSLRQFYRDCNIYGTVDFIFGNAAVVFQNCNLYARLPGANQQNMFTAQGRSDPNQNTGTSIINCSVLATPDLSANGQIKSFLGRPWKNYSRTVYMQSFIDSVIDPSGWAPWSGDFALSTLYYGEYNNTGPGAGVSNRVSWPGYRVMGDSDAANFTLANFVQGDVWLPATSVPFSAGLA